MNIIENINNKNIAIISKFIIILLINYSINI